MYGYVVCDAVYVPLALAQGVFDFLSNHKGLNDPKGNKTIICTMVKYG